MMKSMTAFGRAKETVGGREITAELKSVNSRYFDCSVKLSRTFSPLEDRIKPYLMSKGISRGKLDVYIGAETVESDGVEICLDSALAGSYVEALKKLRDTYSLHDDISVMEVARLGDVFVRKKPDEDIERDWEDVKSVLDKATDIFLDARAREGASLEADLSKKLTVVRKIVDKIETLSEGNIASYKAKLEERIRKMLDDNKISVDESRILTECAIFADKVSIDEEIVRLRSHFDAFDKISESTEPVGRKLDFL
ncbi:MAG: YicC family protein, partial [Eubacteriales bacterium]